MTPKVKKIQETRIGGKARTEPPWNVILHNDNNSINRVVWRLWRTMPGMTMKKATKVTWEAHAQGRAGAKTYHKELAELYEERRRAKGLTISIEPTRWPGTHEKIRTAKDRAGAPKDPNPTDNRHEGVRSFRGRASRWMQRPSTG